MGSKLASACAAAVVALVVLLGGCTEELMGEASSCDEFKDRAIGRFGDPEEIEPIEVSGVEAGETWYWWSLGVSRTFELNARGEGCSVRSMTFEPIG